MKHQNYRNLSILITNIFLTPLNRKSHYKLDLEIFKSFLNLFICKKEEIKFNNIIDNNFIITNDIIREKIKPHNPN